MRQFRLARIRWCWQPGGRFRYRHFRFLKLQNGAVVLGWFRKWLYKRSRPGLLGHWRRLQGRIYHRGFVQLDWRFRGWFRDTQRNLTILLWSRQVVGFVLGFLQVVGCYFRQMGWLFQSEIRRSNELVWQFGLRRCFVSRIDRERPRRFRFNGRSGRILSRQKSGWR